MIEQTLRISIIRYDPDVDAAPVARWYQVPDRRGLTVLEALRYVWENEDPDLAFRYACRVQRCGACKVVVNGRLRLACSTTAEDGMQIEAARGAQLIRDLVTDIFPNTDESAKRGERCQRD